MNMEELFIVLFISKLLFLPRRQTLQVALALLTKTTTKTKGVQVESGKVCSSKWCVLNGELLFLYSGEWSVW